MRFLSLFLLANWPVWSGELSPLQIFSFRLTESSADIVRRLGREGNSVRQGPWQVLQFPEQNHASHANCDGSFEWEFLFDSSGRLTSATWTPEQAVSTASVFGTSEPDVYMHTDSGMKSTVMVRPLAGGRLLIANVTSPTQAKLHQVVLIREEAVGRFIPWLAQQISPRVTK